MRKVRVTSMKKPSIFAKEQPLQLAEQVFNVPNGQTFNITVPDGYQIVNIIEMLPEQTILPKFKGQL
jgi:hypothetical protein